MFTAINYIDGLKYAIKRIKLSNNQKEATKTIKEASVLSWLHHPNIVWYQSTWIEDDFEESEKDESEESEEESSSKVVPQVATQRRQSVESSQLKSFHMYSDD